MGDFTLSGTLGIKSGVLSGAGIYAGWILASKAGKQASEKPTLLATNSERLPMMINRGIKENESILTPAPAIAIPILLGLLLLTGGTVTTTDLLNKDKSSMGFQALDWKKMKQQDSFVPKIMWLFGKIYLGEVKAFVSMTASGIRDNIISSEGIAKTKDGKETIEDGGDSETKSKLPNQGPVVGNVEGAPPVDAGHQGKHVHGHVNDKDPDRSKWPEGNDGVQDTQEAWLNGETLPDGTKVWDTGKVVGENGETGVRVHMRKGMIHGYPVDAGRYLNRH